VESVKSDRVVVVFAKRPAPGAVKTRIVSPGVHR